MEKIGNKVIFKNSHLQLEFDLNSGFFDIIDFKNEKILLRNVYSEIEISNHIPHQVATYFQYNNRIVQKENIEDILGKGEKLRIINCEHPHQPVICLEIYGYENIPYLIFQTTIKNTLNFPLKINKISPVSLSSEKGSSLFFENFERLYFYKQGWQSWSPSWSLKIGEKEDIIWISLGRRMLNYDEKRKSKRGSYFSEFMTLLGRENEIFIFGFISAFSQFSGIEFDKEKFFLKCVCFQEGVELKEGEEVSSERLLLGFGNNPIELVTSYAEIVKKQMNARTREIAPCGWCSWYYYFRNIDEEKILTNLKIIKEEGIPIEYFQIDDGYQREIGDWLFTNNKFKNGMEYIASKIKEVNFKPGIWVAPFVVRKTSEIYKRNPDWLLKDEKGRDVVAGFNPLWGGFYYALDVSNPEVLQYIRDVFKKIREWGYKFIKIDFIFAGALKGKYYNSSLTRCQIYRNAISAIREGVGEDVFILGCGAPLLPSVGIVDAMRISTDVAPFWVDRFFKIFFGEKFTLGAKNAILNTLTRFFFHKNLWINDPDCVLVRKEKNKLKEEEVKSLLTIIGLSGGMTLSSDNFQKLEKERKKLLYLIFPNFPYSAKAIDFFKKSFPEIFLIEEKDYKIVSISNFEDKIKNIEVTFKEINLSEDKKYHFFEFWSKKYFQFKEKIKILKVKPHTTNLFYIRENRGIPQILGVDFHLLGPLTSIKEEYYSSNLKELYFEVFSYFEKSGEIFVYIPDKYKIEEIFTDVFNYEKEFKENILKICLKLKGKCYFKIKFNV